MQRRRARASIRAMWRGFDRSCTQAIRGGQRRRRDRVVRRWRDRTPAGKVQRRTKTARLRIRRRHAGIGERQPAPSGGGLRRHARSACGAPGRTRRRCMATAAGAGRRSCVGSVSTRTAGSSARTGGSTPRSCGVNCAVRRRQALRPAAEQESRPARMGSERKGPSRDAYHPG